MHFERIFIQKNFQSHPVDNPFLYVNIGIGLFIKEGEYLEDAEKAAEQYIAEYIQKNTIYPEHSHIETRAIPEDQLPEIQVSNPFEIREATLEEQIRSCKEVKVLETYKFIIRNNHELQTAYDDTMDELLNTPAIN